MMRRLFFQLSSQSSVYGLSAAASKLVGLVLVPVYTHLLTQADFEHLWILLSPYGDFSAVLVLGLDMAAAVNFYADDDVDRRRQVLSTFLTFELVLTTGASLALFAAAQPLAALLLGDTRWTGAVQLAVALVPFSTFVTIFLDIARLSRQPWRYLTIALGSLVLTAILIIVAVVGLGWGVVGVLGGTLLGNAVFAGVAWAVTRPGGGLSLPLLRRMLRMGLPLVPATLAYWVINFSNLWFLDHLASLNDVAILSLATRLVAPVVLLVTAFQIAWVPFSLSIARQEAAAPVYARTLLYFLAATFATLLLLALFAQPLIVFFGTEAYLPQTRAPAVLGSPAAQVLALAGMSSIAYGAYYIVATGVNLTGRTVHIGWTTVVAAGVSIALNLLLIPPLGILGAALASLVANLVPVLLLYRIAQRLHYVPYDLGRVGLLVGAGVAGLVGAALVQGPLLAWDLLALRAVLLAAFGAALFALGIIRGRDVAELSRWARGLARRAVRP